MRVSKPTPLLRVVFCSILSIVAILSTIGGYYSLPASTGVVYHQHAHSPFSYQANHAHFPLTFYSTLISESAEEEVDEDSQEDEIREVSANAPFVLLVSCHTFVKTVALPRLRQAVLNRKTVFLFILYHSWKSFLC